MAILTSSHKMLAAAGLQGPRPFAPMEHQHPLQTHRHISPNSKRFISQDSSCAPLRERNCIPLTECILSSPFESYK